METKLSGEDLVQAVRRIMDADGTEEELDSLLSLVERSVPHPSVADLIFHPENGAERSAEEIVEIALGCQPIEAGPVDGPLDERGPC